MMKLKGKEDEKFFSFFIKQKYLPGERVLVSFQRLQKKRITLIKCFVKLMEKHFYRILGEEVILHTKHIDVG